MDAEGGHQIAVSVPGTLGPGLSLVFARAGYSVSPYSRTSGRGRALSIPAADLGTPVRHELLDAGDVPAALARDHAATTAFAAVCDLFGEPVWHMEDDVHYRSGEPAGATLSWSNAPFASPARSRSSRRRRTKPESSLA